jgi:hypothetical protein
VPVKKKTLDFFVTGAVVVMVEIPIAASTLEDALGKARELGVSDYVEVLGEHLDGSAVVHSVRADNWRVE